MTGMHFMRAIGTRWFLLLPGAVKPNIFHLRAVSFLFTSSLKARGSRLLVMRGKPVSTLSH